MMNKNLIFYLGLPFLLDIAIGSGPVLANDKEAFEYLLELPLEELVNVKIVTASKHQENIRDTPTTVIVITKQQILNRRYVNLIDLLADLPGVDVQRATEETRYHNITLRGHLGNNKFLILQDGVRIDSPTGEAIPIADNFPLYHAKQVEILYGPAAALYGADAFGGVINIITEDAKEINGVHVATSLGSSGYRYNYVQAGKQFNEQFSIVAGGHKHSADTADLSKYYPNDYGKVAAVTFSGKTVVAAKDREGHVAPVVSESAFLKVTVGKNLTLGFNHSFFRSLSSTGDKPSATLFTEEAQWDTEINTSYGKYHFNGNEHLSGETLINYTTYEVAPESGFQNIFVDFRHTYKYSKGRKRGIEQQLSYQFNDQQNLIGGLSYEDFYALPKTADLPHPFDPQKTYNEQNLFYDGTDNTLPIQLLDANYTNSAGYLQLQSVWNERWSSTIGLRYDKNSRYESTFNPRLGLIYKPVANTVIKLLYGEAFRAPAPVESLNIYGTFTGQKNEKGEYIAKSFRVPNLNLRPEKVRTTELSVSETWPENLTMFVSGYYTEVEELIDTMTEKSPSQFIPGGYIESATVKDNVGKGRHYGADLGLNYQRGLNDSLMGSFWGSYSFIEGDVTNAQGNTADLPYIARHKLKLGATFSYQNKYVVTPQIYLIGRTDTNKNDPSHPGGHLQSPGYALVNLHLGARQVLVKGLSTNLDIYNLFDTRYYNAGGVTSNVTFVGTPQPPRALMFSLRYQF
jgi:outer membrane receptor protein involved in Fe transport